MYDIRLSDVDTIVFDYDETIFKSIDGFQYAYHKIHGGDYPILGKVRKWNFEDIIPDITPRKVETIFASETFFEILKPYNDMIEAMKWFKSKGKKITILSLGTPLNLHYKSKHIYENLTGLYDYLILAGSENNLKMDKSLFNFGKRSVLIDDSENNLFSSSAEYKILSRLYTKEPAEWNSRWNGLEIKNGNELINLFR